MFTRHVTAACIMAFLVVGIGVAQADLETGLVAHFTLDEESGTIAADASGNGYDGTVYGQGVEWIPARFGGGLSLSPPDGEGGVEFATTGMSVTAGTVSVWGYLTEPQAARTRYFFGHTTRPPYSNRIQLYMNSGVNTLSLGLGDTHARQADIIALKTKTWHHIVLTWNNGNYVVYANGDKVAEGTYTGLTTLDPVASVSDDSNPDEHEAFDGVLDEARIYSRAISADEVKQLFQVPASPRIKAWGPTPADGARDVVLPMLSWKSLDTIRLHNIYVGTDPNLTAQDLIGPRKVGNIFYYPMMEPGVTYYWRVDEIGSDLKTVYPGDVWSFLAQPLIAYDPSPADGSNTASPAASLTWLAGTGAATHHVYFGDSLEAVTQGAPEVDKGILEDPNFLPGELQSASVYFWRVDEIGADDTVQPGAVWSFATMIPIDDFEDYTDDVGSRIFQSWIDGLGYTEPPPGNPGNGSGATVGNATEPFTEQTIVHGGKQSMPLDYNNVNSPWYSETERTFAPAQDWTVDGVDTLVLYVQARAGNGPGPLYVSLKDTSNRTAAVVCPDASIVTATKWSEWKVPLVDFTGVSLDRIKAMSIGVGDLADPSPGDSGLLYIDDVGLTRPLPARE
ncbi:MAG: LamG domain-containing protein [Sedimentisphaerales bacterium]|nr:LamG domain-containing protein [Sedimentisphaerales bacterium]